jgi:beta-glucanase (GH16 family)
MGSEKRGKTGVKGIRMIRIAAVGAAFCLTGAMILQMTIFTYRQRMQTSAPRTAASEEDAAEAEDAAETAKTTEAETAETAETTEATNSAESAEEPALVSETAASGQAVSSGQAASSGAENSARQEKSSAAMTAAAATSGTGSAASVSVLTENFMAVAGAEHNNNELSVYETGQVSFSGGDTVLLTAERKGENYVSGMVESAESYLYGEFSFTVTVPEGAGLFPSIWMLSTAGTALPEIDIFEHVGTEPDRYSGVLHYFTDQKRRAYFIYDFENGMPRQYTVGLSWHQDLLIWTLNGAEVFRTASHVPDEPMYLIMCLAVGGNWPGDPDENTVFPAVFKVKIEHLEPETAAPRQEG